MSQSKTRFLGILIAMDNYRFVFQKLHLGIENKLEYLCGYTVSEDLEKLFSVIQSRSDWNNNPNCKQFTSTYK